MNNCFLRGMDERWTKPSVDGGKSHIGLIKHEGLEIGFDRIDMYINRYTRKMTGGRPEEDMGGPST